MTRPNPHTLLLIAIILFISTPFVFDVIDRHIDNNEITQDFKTRHGFNHK